MAAFRHRPVEEGRFGGTWHLLAQGTDDNDHSGKLVQ
jgi:hypothetical protein